MSVAQVSKRDLSTRDHTAKRLSCKFLKAMIYGRLNQRTATKVLRFAGEDLNARGASGTNGEVREHAKDGVIGGLKECIQALRTTLSSRRLTIGTLLFAIRS